MKTILEELSRAGLDEQTVIDLGQPSEAPEHLRYLDLLRTSAPVLLPDAVVESAGQPFAYVIRRDRLGDAGPASQESLEKLIRVLACRSDARYLCVLTPGAMDVYPVAFHHAESGRLIVPQTGRSPTWLDLLSRSVDLDVEGRTRQAEQVWVEDLLFRLLVEAANGIRDSVPHLSVSQTLALVGRALFFRFLVDRHIIGADDLEAICPSAAGLESVFDSKRALISTCKWLDRTFNGDLLSLGDQPYEQVIESGGDSVSRVCWHLTNIQHRSLSGQLAFSWSGIQFKHVPVDVLSQVYENFAHRFVPDLARQTSVHFTPRQLAEVLIDGVFGAVQGQVHRAKVLDPSAGGGVFLVLALRRLVLEQWKATGSRPGRAAIRKILNEQLCGLDINGDALNIAALSLYLAALELDPKPSPISELKFDKLIGKVLLHVDRSSLGNAPDAELGSLSARVDTTLRGRFDIVVGNPPWTGLWGPAADKLDQCVARLAQALSKGTPKVELLARYGSPDVAFLLAATRWAKPRGAIGFALHARLLFQPMAANIRSLLFANIRVTGVMNFSALRQDKRLWPSNSAPFALLVAINSKPDPQESFYFISPRHEPYLEALGQFRIDPSAAIPVPLRLICETPFAFKALYRGSRSGVDLVSRIIAAGPPLRETLNQNHLLFRSGYQVGKEMRRTESAELMLGLPEAAIDMQFTVSKDANSFGLSEVQWPRKREIYNGPLLLFRESPKLERAVRGALYAQRDTVYREAFLGLSFALRPDLSHFMDALYVVSYSDLLLYYTLLTSAKFGVERDSALQKDIENFPFPPMEVIEQHQPAIDRVSRALRKGQPNWVDLNAVVSKIYGLSDADQSIVEDTLATELPFTETQLDASAPASTARVVQFVSEFNRIVEPFVGDGGQTASAIRSPLAGWAFLAIGKGSKNASDDGATADVAALTSVASSYWASELRLKHPDGWEVLGRLNQNRYWTKTQAREAAIRWLRSSDQRS